MKRSSGMSFTCTASPALTVTSNSSTAMPGPMRVVPRLSMGPSGKLRSPSVTGSSLAL
jgi:hypothetical protein